VLYKLARQLGAAVDRVEMDNVEFAFATKDFEVPARSVEKGKIAGLSFDYTGYVGDRAFLKRRWVHHVDPLLLTASLSVALAVHGYRIPFNESDLTDVTP
jgi:hypothetical protein